MLASVVLLSLLAAGGALAESGDVSLLAFRASLSKRKLIDPETGVALPAPFLGGFDACRRTGRLWSRGRYGPLPTPHTAQGAWAATRPELDVGKLSGFTARRAPEVDLVLPSPAEVAAWVTRANVQSPVVLHAFNVTSGGHYIDWVYAWAWHAQRVGVLQHALFVSPAAEDCAAVRKLAPCLVHDDFGTPLRVSDATRIRWLYAWMLIQAGMDVIVLDADAFLLENPLSILAAQPSSVFVQGLSDRRENHKHLPYCDAAGSPCQSTGFTFIRSRAVTKRQLTSFIAQLRNVSTWEQVSTRWRRRVSFFG